MFSQNLNSEITYKQKSSKLRSMGTINASALLIVSYRVALVMHARWGKLNYIKRRGENIF